MDGVRRGLSGERLTIEVTGLHKRFGRTQALDGLDLHVRPGSVHGFLGPNGAGKSTTIRILLGLVRRDSGTPRLLGGDPWREAVPLHRRLAYVPGDVALWPSLTAGQCLDLLGSVAPAPAPSVRRDLLERFDLDPSRRARDLSKGNRQKVALVAAFASPVELLVLDEPTTGLDPIMEQVFQQCVRERAAAGTTVLLSSHLLAEVEALCDEVSIIRRGRTVTSGTLDDLRRHARTSVQATTARPVDGPGGLGSVAGVADLAVEPVDVDVDGAHAHRVRFSVPPASLGAALDVLRRAGVEALTATPPSLDDLFLSAYAAPGPGAQVPADPVP